MSKVLFISYFFAPHNDAGTFRSVNFVKRLPGKGIEPIVITTTRDSILEKGGRIDETINQGLPADIEIIRIEDTNSAFKFWSKIKLYRIPWTLCYRKFIDVYASWSRSMVDPAVEKIKSESIPIIYVSCAPISAAYSAIKIKKRTGAKLVVDFRDPFTDAYGYIFPGKINWKVAGKIERQIVEEADSVIVNTNEVKKLFIRKYPSFESKINVITNGY